MRRTSMRNYANSNPLDDIDLLIAGIALANHLVLVTRNTRHFERINGLELADWSQPIAERGDEQRDIER